MRARIRALEQALVCQRSYVVVEPIASDYIDAWEQALEKDTDLPDELGLLPMLAPTRVPVLTIGPLLNYLSQCRKDNRIPDLARLTETIVHGYIQTRLDPRKKCRCTRHPL
ncbi:MAG: hypothetical protein O3B65_01800 [Chloroflexi bacterium]|nr:hypothetical protein [Chloroflexota bacterium]